MHCQTISVCKSWEDHVDPFITNKKKLAAHDVRLPKRYAWRKTWVLPKHGCCEMADCPYSMCVG